MAAEPPIAAEVHLSGAKVRGVSTVRIAACAHQYRAI